MFGRATFGLVAVLAAAWIGCQDAPAPANTDNSWAKGTIDGVSCEVRGKRNSSSLVGNGYHEFTAGDNTLRLQGGHITANGKDYGDVNSGDSVLLDGDG